MAYAAACSIGRIARDVRRADAFAFGFRMDMHSQVSDREFVLKLRTATDAYLGAVDRWEAAFHRYYRMPDRPGKISSDMEAEQRDYDARRRELETLLPRARRLCLKHELHDPFSHLTRVALGRFAPQHRTDSVIGRGERSAVSACLLELREASTEWPTEAQPPRERPKPANRSLLGRMIDYFY
jgi:hypothetical protein